jgi:hypothetical protein
MSASGIGMRTTRMLIIATGIDSIRKSNVFALR